MLAPQARQMEGVNRAENDQEEVAADLVATVSLFTARLYGQRRAKQAKRKTEQIAADLRGDEGEAGEEREGDANAAG
jgi:predicted site-specific integrase-resolvase